MAAPLRVIAVLAVTLLSSQAIAQAPAPAVQQAIEATVARFERGLAQRDRAALETVIATPFVWVHGSDGRIETRSVWLNNAAQGMALTGQRVSRTEHGPSLMTYGADARTAVRVARIQLVDSATAHESWMRQSLTFARGDDGAWRIAAGQGTLMYEGQRLDPAMHARYTGTYVLPDGRRLLMEWEDGGLFATLPNGGKSQIFLGSPTDEVTRTVGGGRLRFTLDRDGRPLTAALVRGDVEAWRAKRQP